MSEYSFYLRGENQATALLIKVERLDADVVAREHESFALRIPQCYGEVAFDVVHEVEAALFVKVNDRLAVGARLVLVPARFERGAQACVVVNLSVEDEPHAAPFAPSHRLVARAREVNDRESPEAEAETPAVEQARARVVRPAVRHRVAQALDGRALHAPLRRPVLPDSADAAHNLSQNRLR